MTMHNGTSAARRVNGREGTTFPGDFHTVFPARAVAYPSCFDMSIALRRSHSVIVEPSYSGSTTAPPELETTMGQRVAAQMVNKSG